MTGEWEGVGQGRGLGLLVTGFDPGSLSPRHQALFFQPPPGPTPTLTLPLHRGQNQDSPRVEGEFLGAQEEGLRVLSPSSPGFSRPTWGRILSSPSLLPAPPR